MGHQKEQDPLRMVLAVITTIAALYIYGVFLSRFYSKDLTPFSALYQFFANRISRKPFSSNETGALVSMVLCTLSLSAIGYLVYIKTKSLIRARGPVSHIKRRFGSSQGTAEFGHPQDLAKLKGRDGIIIGYHLKRPVRYSRRTSCEHTAVIGPTGCGKTSCFFIPNLLSLQEDCSAVVTDPKGEIEAYTAAELRRRGWDVYTLNVGQPERSIAFNPLAIAKDETEVAELAEIILINGYSFMGRASNTQWINFSQPLWEAAMLAEIERAKMSNDIPCIANAGKIITAYSEAERAEMFRIIGGTALERYAAYSQSIQSPETAASIRSVITSSTRLFNRFDIAQITKGEPGRIFNPIWLRQKPSIFYIQYPERKSVLLKPFNSTLYWQLLEHIIDLGDMPVFFFLDEFPNLGQIPGFSQIAATVRSRKISLNIGLQGIEQLSREYSTEEQKDILNNMKTKIYFPGSTGESGAYTSELLGYSTSKSKINKEEQRRELLTTDELRRIPDNYVMVLAHNLNPILLESIPYYKQRRFRHMHQR